jgi:hypothetical protein
MSTKTIAVETSVYEKLARQKRASESFTKTINRLLETSTVTGTCADAVASAARIWRTAGNDDDAALMEQLIRDGRSQTNWEVEQPS